MRDLKRLFLFLAVVIVAQACSKKHSAAFNFHSTGYYYKAAKSATAEAQVSTSHQQMNTEPTQTVTPVKASAWKILVLEKIVSHGNKGQFKPGTQQHSFTTRESDIKHSDPDPNATPKKKNSLIKDILIAVALTLASVVLGTLVIIGVTLLFPTMSQQGILLIALVITVALSVAIPRLLQQ